MEPLEREILEEARIEAEAAGPVTYARHPDGSMALDANGCAVADDATKPEDPARAPFKRITSPGTTDAGRLFITIDWDGRRLSITGVEGPKANGDCCGSCGQTGIPSSLISNPGRAGWDTHKVEVLRQDWSRWHLNNMQPACEHQRNDPAHDTSKPLTLQHLTWGPRYHAARDAAAAGELDAQDYAMWQRVSAQVAQFFPLATADLWGKLGDELLESGMLKIDKTETKTAGWVNYREHPEGLLSKPCAVCWYPYGSAWLYEEVPTDVLEFLRGLPDDSNDMPGRWRD